MKSLPFKTMALRRRIAGFTLLEMLTVIGVITILSLSSIQIAPSLFQANQLDKNVTDLTGTLEYAREAAISGNTYVWVAFTSVPASASTSKGVGVVVFESQDGIDSLSNFTLGTTAAPKAISTTNNLLVLRKFQQLSGIQLVSPNTLAPTGLPTLSASAAALQGSMGLTLNIGGTPYTFTQVVEFVPDGEAHVATWNNCVEFGIQSALRPNSPNIAVLRLARLTGRTTVYRQ